MMLPKVDSARMVSMFVICDANVKPILLPAMTLNSVAPPTDARLRLWDT